MDSYTLVSSHQFDLIYYYYELHGGSGETKRHSFELLGLTLDTKMQVFPGLDVYWYMEVNVLEVCGITNSLV